MSSFSYLSDSLKARYQQTFEDYHEDSRQYHERQFAGMRWNTDEFNIINNGNSFLIKIKIEEHMRTADYADQSSKQPREKSRNNSPYRAVQITYIHNEIIGSCR